MKWSFKNRQIISIRRRKNWKSIWKKFSGRFVKFLQLSLRKFLCVSTGLQFKKIGVRSFGFLPNFTLLFFAILIPSACRLRIKFLSIQALWCLHLYLAWLFSIVAEFQNNFCQACRCFLLQACCWALFLSSLSLFAAILGDLLCRMNYSWPFLIKSCQNFRKRWFTWTARADNCNPISWCNVKVEIFQKRSLKWWIAEIDTELNQKWNSFI